MATNKEVLELAADIVEKRGWTRGVMARNIFGQGCSVYSEDACYFCMSGAIDRALDEINENEEFNYIDAFLTVSNAVPSEYKSIAAWNDNVAENAGQVAMKLREMAKVLDET